MELLTKKLIITDSKGEEVNVKRKNIGIYLNGKKTDFSMRDLFKYTEYDDGEIYGDSLLGYYAATDDGKLSVAGSVVEFRDEDSGEQIKVVKIKRPGLTNDDEITFEEVQKFAHDFSIEKPEEVFPDLNDEEKQVFIAEREKREAETAKEKAAAAQALAEAETARVAKEKEDAEKETLAAAVKADKDLRESLKPASVYDEKGMRELRTYYKDKKCGENTTPPYHVFHGAQSEEEPCLLIKRGKDWWEQPEQTALQGETPDKLIIEFTDLGTQRELAFNTETGSIKLKE